MVIKTLLNDLVIYLTDPHLAGAAASLAIEETPAGILNFRGSHLPFAIAGG